MKNYNIKRITALALAFVFFAVSGLFTCFFIKGVFYYNRYQTNGDYTTSNVFLNGFHEFERSVIETGEISSCESNEDFAKTDIGSEMIRSANRKAERVKSACDYLDSAGLKLSADYDDCFDYSDEKGNYVFSKEGFITEVNYSYSNNQDESVTQLNEESSSDQEYETTGNENYTQVYSEVDTPENEEITCEEDNFETTTMLDYANRHPIEKALRTVYENTGEYYGSYTTEELVKICLKEADYKAFIDHYYNNLSDYNKSIKYAVFYNTTGKVFTNCDIKAQDDTETILKKLGGSYAEYYENGEIKDTGKKNVFSSSVSYSDIGDSIKENGFPTSDLKNIDRAYFAYNQSEELDMMSVSVKAYNSYYKSSSIHGRGQNNNLNFYFSIMAVTFILACACCIYLFAAAGKTELRDIKLRFYDRLPLALNLFVTFAIQILMGMAIFFLSFYEYYFIRIFIDSWFPIGLLSPISAVTNQLTAFFFAVFCITGAGLITSIVRNIKNKTFFKHTLCRYCLFVFAFIFRKIRTLFHRFTEKTKEIYDRDYAYGNGRKFIAISASILAAVTLFFLIFISFISDGHQKSVFFLFLCMLAIDAVIMFLLICFDRIASGVTEIKLGSLTCNINTALMPGFMKSTAEDISTISEGFKAAVEQAVKEQTTKTELLTNVTHDLKTPLTSIITYVDLLKKTDNPEEQSQYIAVLDEKSQRLKKLIDDLVQASKAASGNVEVNIVRLNLNEFASQIIGENEDELREKEIEIILRESDEPVFVNADANVTCRILENLISNIKKYAMKGTRAYVEVYVEGGYGVIAFKNVSAFPLEADADKYTERFFTGDKSRTGESNGLGLSIAINLCNVQNGRLEIGTDGDLFKATVYLLKA